MQVIKIEGLDIENITRVLAKACFLSGFSVQSFSLPGRGYVKFDKKPVVSRQEEFPDFLLVMDSTRSIQDALRHAKEKSVVIVNAKERPKSPMIRKRKLKVYNLDATQLSLNSIRKPAPDAPLLGALVRHCDGITSRAARLALGENKELHAAMDEGYRNVK